MPQKREKKLRELDISWVYPFGALSMWDDLPMSWLLRLRPVKSLGGTDKQSCAAPKWTTWAI